MSKKIERSLKQLRRALQEQRDYEIFLKEGSDHRFESLIAALLPHLPLLINKFTPSRVSEPVSTSPLGELWKEFNNSLRPDQKSTLMEQVGILMQGLDLPQRMLLTEIINLLQSSPGTKTPPP